MDNGSVIRVRGGWRATTTHTAGRVLVDVQERAPTTEFAVVARAEHVAAALIGSLCSAAAERRPTEALFGEFQSRVVVPLGLAKIDAGFDGHTGQVCVAGPAQGPAGFLLIVAALAEVGADLLYGGGWDVGCQVVQTH